MTQLSRRRFVALSAAAAGAMTTGMSAGLASPALAQGGPRVVDPRLSGPVDRAFGYLDVVQDAYFQGGTPRLLQSYNNESGLLTTACIRQRPAAIAI
jgi:hypothetical protein